MEHEVFTLEAITHYFRGAATLFYIFWSLMNDNAISESDYS